MADVVEFLALYEGKLSRWNTETKKNKSTKNENFIMLYYLFNADNLPTVIDRDADPDSHKKHFIGLQFPISVVKSLKPTDKVIAITYKGVESLFLVQKVEVLANYNFYITETTKTKNNINQFVSINNLNTDTNLNDTDINLFVSNYTGNNNLFCSSTPPPCL